jgi:hypothetical protein
MVVSYPAAGNVNPALQLAKLLHHHDTYITFVNTKHNHLRVQDIEGADTVLLDVRPLGSPPQSIIYGCHCPPVAAGCNLQHNCQDSSFSSPFRLFFVFLLSIAHFFGLSALLSK